MSSSHSIEAVRAIRSLCGGSGGGVLVVSGEPGSGALFPAGMRRSPVGTLLESVLNFASGPGPDHVWVLSAADDSLPHDLGVGQPRQLFRGVSCAWVLRGSGTRTGAQTRQATEPPPGETSVQDQWKKRLSGGRPTSTTTDGGLLEILGTGWDIVLPKVLTHLETACGKKLIPGQPYGKSTDRPTGRILVVLDERLLYAIKRHELASLGAGEPSAGHFREHATRRLNSLPRLFSESVANGTPADLILLARDPSTADLLRSGLMINRQMAIEYRQIERFGPEPDLTREDERFVSMKWLGVPKARIMPRVDRDHPLGKSFTTPNTKADTYANLCRHAIPREVPSPLEHLNRLIGLSQVKHEIQGVFAELERASALEESGRTPPAPPRRHLIFAGNPGTGKTTVAEIIGKLYAERGILSGNKFTVVTDKDLVAEHVGGTANKCEAAFERAAGGVLFIDEAYRLTPRGEVDYNHAVITSMVDWMTKRSRDLAFILAGYSAEMRAFLKANPGLESRVRWIEFENYTDDNLMAISRTMLTQSQECLGEGAEEAMRERLAVRREQAIQRNEPFANGREVENLLVAVRRSRSLRLFAPGAPRPTDQELTTFTVEDVWTAVYPPVASQGDA